MKSDFIRLIYPNDTFVTIEGDRDIIVQILRRLDNQMIGFEIREDINTIKDGWDLNAMKAILEDKSL